MPTFTGLVSDGFTGNQDREETQTTKFATFELNYSKLRLHTSQKLEVDLFQRNQSRLRIRRRDNLRMGVEKRKRIPRLNGGEY